MKEFVIEGINGAGKTPTIDHLRPIVEAEGLSLGVYAPFHLLRSKINIPDIYPLWASEPSRAVTTLKETIREAHNDALQAGHDVLIYDRHWMTVLAQADIAPNVDELWGDDFLPTFVLTSPIEHSLRIAERGYSAEWLSRDGIQHYARRYDQLCKEYHAHIIGQFDVRSTAQDLSPIANSIAEILIKEFQDAKK